MGVITRTAGMLVSGLFSVGFVALGLITLLPADSSKPNLIGYYGVCTFAPASTSILFVFALVLLAVTFKIRNMSVHLPYFKIPSKTFHRLYGRSAKTARAKGGADYNRC